MKTLAIIGLAVAAFVAGIVAAWKWYRSSKVEIDLGYGLPWDQSTYTRMGIEMPRRPEPFEPEQKWMNDISATWEAMNQTARLQSLGGFRETLVMESAHQALLAHPDPALQGLTFGPLTETPVKNVAQPLKYRKVLSAG